MPDELDNPYPHFRGFDPHAPIQCFTRSLPHWRQNGATYFLTFRLADAIPKTKREALNQERAEWLQRNPPPHSPDQIKAYEELFSHRIEHWLDQGIGSCALGVSENARLVEGALKHFAGERYRLFAWVIMPNHVHCMVRPQGDHSLDDIWKSWKGFTAHELANNGVSFRPIWFRECYDRIVRDEDHLHKVVSYIFNNPAKAGLKSDSCPLGLHKEWNPNFWSDSLIEQTVLRRLNSMR